MTSDIQDIDEKGVIPTERFKNHTQVRDLCQTMVDDDKGRGEYRSQYQGLIDGNPPYNSQELANLGIECSNVSFRGAEGAISAVTPNYFDLAYGVKPFVSVSLELYDTAQDRFLWQQKIAAHAHKTVFGWTDWTYNLQLQQRSMLVDGLGAHVWTGNHGPWFETLPAGNILFPKGTKTSLAGLEFFMVRQFAKPHQLAAKVKNPKAQKKAGWEPDTVYKLIHAAAGDSTSFSAEAVQKSLREGDLGYTRKSRDIELWHLFVKEYETEKISHYIVAAQQDAAKGYVYRKQNKYETWEHVISIFPYDIGADGTIHGIKGLGHRIFSFFSEDDRLKNTMIDMVHASKPGIQSSGSAEDVMVANLGMFNLFPPNVNAFELNFGGLKEGPLALSRELQGSYQENTKMFRQSASDDGRELSASEYLGRAADQKQHQKAAHNYYYVQADKFYREIVRRLCDPAITKYHEGGREALKFQECCQRDGVPEEVLTSIWKGDATVLATRRFQPASSADMALTEKMLERMEAGANEQERANLRIDFATAVVGPDMAERYAGLDKVMTDDHWVANAENEFLENGGITIIAPSQNDIYHLETHLPFLDDRLKGAREQRIPMDRALDGLQAVHAHCIEHVDRLERDQTRRADAGNYRQLLQTFAGFIDQLRQNYQEQQEAQGKQPDVEMDAARKDFIAQKDIQRKDALAAAEIERKEKIAQAELASKDAVTASKITSGRPPEINRMEEK